MCSYSASDDTEGEDLDEAGASHGEGEEEEAVSLESSEDDEATQRKPSKKQKRRAKTARAKKVAPKKAKVKLPKRRRKQLEGVAAKGAAEANAQDTEQQEEQIEKAKKPSSARSNRQPRTAAELIEETAEFQTWLAEKIWDDVTDEDEKLLHEGYVKANYNKADEKNYWDKRKKRATGVLCCLVCDKVFFSERHESIKNHQESKDHKKAAAQLGTSSTSSGTLPGRVPWPVPFVDFLFVSVVESGISVHQAYDIGRRLNWLPQTLRGAMSPSTCYTKLWDAVKEESTRYYARIKENVAKHRGGLVLLVDAAGSHTVGRHIMGLVLVIEGVKYVLKPWVRPVKKDRTLPFHASEVFASITQTLKDLDAELCDLACIVCDAASVNTLAVAALAYDEVQNSSEGEDDDREEEDEGLDEGNVAKQYRRIPLYSICKGGDEFKQYRLMRGCLAHAVKNALLNALKDEFFKKRC